MWLVPLKTWEGRLFISFIFLLRSLFIFNWRVIAFNVALARDFNTMLNERDKNGHPCLVPELGGNAFSFSWLSKMLAVYSLHHIEEYSLYMHFVFCVIFKWGIVFGGNLPSSFPCIFTKVVGPNCPLPDYFWTVVLEKTLESPLDCKEIRSVLGVHW